MTLRSGLGVVLALGSIAVLAGCGGGDSGGVITVDGSSTVGPFTTKAAEDFKAARTTASSTSSSRSRRTR